MPTKTAETPAVDPGRIDFHTLRCLDDLPELQPFVEACERLGVEINALDRQIPLAAERHSALWRAFQAPSLVVGTTPTQEDVTVTDAKLALAALQEQRKALAAQAVVARADLAAATVELRITLLPEIRKQLDAPLAGLIGGIECARAIERLCGSVAGHAQARALISVLLPYLTAVHRLLEDKDDA